MSVICIIPARGGSKGIPRKNLQEVGGIPLIDRAIQTVTNSAVADHIIVSTEDAEIANHATQLGATHVQRPIELATDEATSESVLLHTLQALGVTAGDLLFVQTTTPLLYSSDLQDLVKNHAGYDSSLTVTESHGFLWRSTTDGSLTGVNHDPQKRLRRQDIDGAEYLENGAAYLMRIEGFIAARHRFFGRIGCSIMPRSRSVEVDNMDDLLLVRLIDKALAERQQNN